MLMKRLIFILVISSHSFSDQIIEKFQAANARYNDSDYIGAIQLYEEIVSKNCRADIYTIIWGILILGQE